MVKSLTNKSKTPLFIAHRGESNDAPENTLEAINLAWERNADAVEIDIQLTRDDQIIVYHDETFQRLANIPYKVRDLSLEGIKAIDLIGNKLLKWENAKVPLLSEVVATIPDNKILIIEIKTDQSIVPILANLLIKSIRNLDQIQIICFDILVLSAFKKVMPAVKTLWLVDMDYKSAQFKTTATVITNAVHNNMDGVDINATGNLDPEFAVKAHEAGLLVYGYTVNTQKLATKLIMSGFDGITSNKASWLKSKYFKHL